MDENNKNIKWEFDYWYERETGEAAVVGYDEKGVKYHADGIVAAMEVIEVNNVELVKDK